MVLVETNSRLAIAELRRSVRQQRKNFRLAPRESERILASRRARPARNAAHAPFTHLPAQRLGGRSSAHLVEHCEGFALFRFRSVPGEHDRLLVKTAESLPRARRSAPVARDFPRVRVGDIRGMLIEGIHPPQPRCEFAFHPRISSMAHQFVGWLHFPQNARPVAREPGGLGADRGQRADALQLRRRAAERSRFIERRFRIGVAAPNAQVRRESAAPEFG